MKSFSFILITLFLGLNLYANEVLQKESMNSFDVTLKKIEDNIKAKGLGIFTKIDHQEAAYKKANLKMNKSTVIIFGNPKVGTLLMLENPAWSLELPLKIAVFEDNKGKVIVRARTLADDIRSPKEALKVRKINYLLKDLVNNN